MSYNRFEMQVSQTLHMAIEIFDNLDYLFVLDYYDDITIFDKEDDPETVSYFQMKTNEESISINTAITKDWLVKIVCSVREYRLACQRIGVNNKLPISGFCYTKNG